MTSPIGIPSTAGPMRFAVWLLGVGWLVDTCAGGTTSDRIANAMWFNSEDAALAALARAGFDVDDAYERSYVVVSL